MGKVSRTFKLRLSPAGMDVLIAAHCRLIQATRQILPWGTTLHAAVTHLDSFAPAEIVVGLDRIKAAGLCGAEVHFLGAPSTLNDVPALLQIYVLALDLLVSAEAPSLRRAYHMVVA